MRRQNPLVLILVFTAIFFAFYMIPRLHDQAKLINKYEDLTEFYADFDAGKMASLKIIGNERIEGEYTPQAFAGQEHEYGRFAIEVQPDPERADKLVQRAKEQNISVKIDVLSASWADKLWQTLSIAMPLLLILAILYIFTRQMRASGGQALSFGRSQAKLLGDSLEKVTFNDVAGMEEVKEELQEVVDFLRDPEKFRALGAKIPRGVLLVGPPGCGKTLLARAVAGEANVAFFYISGSDFVEMFVGVGASRVRDLFEQTKQHLPAIIFIDELDAVGRLRGAGLGGGHDEREQTLNQLLVEMDGFDPNADVIILGATNRPDILDPALLRPGRFDRHIVVPNPDIREREAILKLYLLDKPLAEDVDATLLARRTPGFSGADLENLVNEAALLAARRDKQEVAMSEFNEATERVIAGPERRSRVISEDERKILAFHEAGHALVGSMIPDFDPTYKVTILPRGMALGYTISLPEDDRYLMSRTEILNRITQALGGRAAEELMLGEITTGAHNDLEKVTELAREMVCKYGMSEDLGPITYGKEQGPIFLGRDLAEDRNYSEEIARQIDKEVRGLVGECYERATGILKENTDTLNLLVEALLEQETLDQEEVASLIETGKLPEPSTEAKEPQQPTSQPQAVAQEPTEAPEVVPPATLPEAQTP